MLWNLCRIIWSFWPTVFDYEKNPKHISDIACPVGNCRKWGMTKIIFMEVTPPVIVQKTVNLSFYLNAVFLGEVLTNEIIKEGRNYLLEAKLENIAPRK